MRQRKHQYLTLYQNWNRTPVYFELVLSVPLIRSDRFYKACTLFLSCLRHFILRITASTNTYMWHLRCLPLERRYIHYKAPWAQFLVVDGSDTLIRKISNINTPNNITLLHNICSLFIINIIPIRAVSVYKHLFLLHVWVEGVVFVCDW